MSKKTKKAAKAKKSATKRGAVTHTTTESEKKERSKRTPAEIVEALKQKILDVEARAVKAESRRAGAAPEIKALNSALKSIGKAHTKADDAPGKHAETIAQALADANDTLTELLAEIVEEEAAE